MRVPGNVSSPLVLLSVIEEFPSSPGTGSQKLQILIRAVQSVPGVNGLMAGMENSDLETK